MTCAMQGTNACLPQSEAMPFGLAPFRVYFRGTQRRFDGAVYGHILKMPWCGTHVTDAPLPPHLQLAPAYAKRASQGSLPLAHKLNASGRTGSGPPSRTNSGASRLGSGSFNGSDPGAALDRAARNAAAAAVKQAKRENSTLQARLATTQERLAEADGGRIQVRRGAGQCLHSIVILRRCGGVTLAPQAAERALGPAMLT